MYPSLIYLVLDTMRCQNLVHIIFVLLGWQFVKDKDVLRAYRFFRGRGQAHDRGSEACPCRLCRGLLLLFLELLVEDFDEVTEAFLAQTNLSLFFSLLIYLDLLFLSQL